MARSERVWAIRGGGQLERAVGETVKYGRTRQDSGQAGSTCGVPSTSPSTTAGRAYEVSGTSELRASI